jgi:hypothetical protein
VSGDQTDFITAGVTTMLGVTRVASLSERWRVDSYGLKSDRLSVGIEIPIGIGLSDGDISIHVLLPGVNESAVRRSLVD